MNFIEKIKILKTIKDGWIDYGNFKVTAEMSDDIDIMLALINQDVKFFNDASPRLKDNKNFAQAVVKEAPYMIGDLGDDLKADVDIAKAALGFKEYSALGHIWRYMSQNVKEEISADRKIMLIESKKSDFSLSFASEELRDDDEIAIQAINTNPHNFLKVGPRLQKNKSLALFALRKGGKIFSQMHPTLRGDREIVEVAVAEDGISIEYASDELRNDPELRKLAKQTLIEQFKNGVPESFTGLAAEKWMEDNSFMSEAVGLQPFLLCAYSPNNIVDRSEWVRNSSEAIRNMRIFNEDLALSAVSINGSFIGYLAPEFRCKKEIILEAARNSAANSQIWECMTEEQKNDRAFIVELIKARPQMINELSPQLQEDKEIKEVFEQSMEAGRQRYREKMKKQKEERFKKEQREQEKKAKIDIKTVSIQVRDEVAKQEVQSEISIAVLLDKRAKMMGYDNYGTQRLSEERGLSLPFELSDEEKKEVERLTQQIEELKGRETNE